MLKKDIKFKDYDGNDTVETHYFNLATHEVIDFESEFGGGLTTFVQAMVEMKDRKRLIQLFKDFIKKTYGRKSEDGKRFIKTQEVFTEFEQTPAYDALYMELVTDTDAAVAFIIGVLPENVRSNISDETIADVKSQVSATVPNLPPPPPPAAA